MGRAHEVRAKKMAATSAAKSALYMKQEDMKDMDLEMSQLLLIH